MTLRELRHGQFLLERRLSYQVMVLFGLAYVFDPRGFWLLAMAAAAGRVIWLRRTYTRDERASVADNPTPAAARADLERRRKATDRHKSWSLGLAGLWALTGLLARVAGFPQFWVTSLVLTAAFIASAGRYRDLAALLDKTHAALPSAPSVDVARDVAR